MTSTASTPRHLKIVETAAPTLITEVLIHYSWVRLRAMGGSMRPTILPADVLLIAACAETDVAPDDIVLFSQRGRLFAHRVLEAVHGKAIRLVTRGDAHWHPDPHLPPMSLLGRVVSIERCGRAIAAPFLCSRFDRTRGLAITEWIRLSRWLRAMVRGRLSRLQNLLWPIPRAVR